MKSKLLADRNFLQIFDALDDMVLVKAAESKLIWANTAFRNFYAMSNEQLIGIIDSPFSKPDYTEKFVQDDKWVFENAKSLDIPRENVVRHDGVVRIFHTVKSPILNSSGQVEMTVGISRDITDQIAVLEALEEQRSRLVYSSKMATLGEMAGGIAHEINTPLAALKMMSSQICEILLDETIDLEQIKRNAERIEQTTDRISKIIDGLRKFSRDGSKDPFANVRLAKIVDETLSFCRERLMSRGINLKIENHAEDLTLDCSPVQISQVLLNLLNNAMDAVSDLLVEKNITIETKSVRDQVYISITDSGSGINRELREKIFSPFFTTKEIGQGTGLGLSISKGIIESHGGELALDETSKATKFVIRLPLKR